MSSSALTHHDEASIKSSVALMFESLLERTHADKDEVDNEERESSSKSPIDVPTTIAALQGLSLQLLHSSLRYHLPVPTNTGERDGMMGLCALSFLEPSLWESITMRWGILFPDPSKPTPSSSTMGKRAATAAAKRGSGGAETATCTATTAVDTTRCQIPIAAPLKKDVTLRFVQMMHRFVAEAEKESLSSSLVNSANKDNHQPITHSPDPTTTTTDPTTITATGTTDHTPLTGHTPAARNASSGRVTFPHVVEAAIADHNNNNMHSPNDGSMMMKKPGDTTTTTSDHASPLPHEVSAAPTPSTHHYPHQQYQHTPATSSRMARDSEVSGVSPSPIFDTTPSSTSASPRAPLAATTTTATIPTTTSPFVDDAARALDYSSTSPLLPSSSMGKATNTDSNHSTSNPVVVISSDCTNTTTTTSSTSPPPSRLSPPSRTTTTVTASTPYVEGQLGVEGGAPMAVDKVASLMSRMTRPSFVLPPPLQPITTTSDAPTNTNPLLLRNTSPTSASSSSNLSGADATRKRLEELFKSRRDTNCVVMPSTSVTTTASSTSGGATTTSPLAAASAAPVSVGSTLRTALGLFGVVGSNTTTNTSSSTDDVPTPNAKKASRTKLSYHAAENLMRSWCGEISLEDEEQAAAAAAAERNHHNNNQYGGDDYDFGGDNEDGTSRKRRGGDVVVLRDIVRTTAELRAWKDNFSRRARGTAEAAEEAQIRQSDYFSMIAAALDFNVQRGQLGCKRPRADADGDNDDETVTLGKDGEVISTTTTTSTPTTTTASNATITAPGGGIRSSKRRSAPSVHPLTINFDAVAWECNHLVQRRHDNPVVGVSGGENNVLLTAYQKHFAPRYVCGPPTTSSDDAFAPTSTTTTTTTVPLASTEALRCFVCGCGTGYIPPQQDASSSPSYSSAHSTRRRGGRIVTMMMDEGGMIDANEGEGSHQESGAAAEISAPLTTVVAAAAILGGDGCGIKREATGTTDSALERVAGMLQCGSCQRVVHPRCVYPTQREVYGPFYCHSCRCMPVDLIASPSSTTPSTSTPNDNNEDVPLATTSPASPTAIAATTASIATSPASPSTASSHTHHHQQYFSTLFGAHNPSHTRNPFPSMKVSQVGGLRNTTASSAARRLQLASPLKKKASSRCSNNTTISTTPVRMAVGGPTTPPTSSTTAVVAGIELGVSVATPNQQQGSSSLTDLLHTPQRITSTSSSSRSLVFPPTSSFSSTASRSLQLSSGGHIMRGSGGGCNDGDREVCVIASSSSSNSPIQQQSSGENSNDSEPKNTNTPIQGRPTTK